MQSIGRVALLVALAAAPAAAQEVGRGFLFGRPEGSITFRGGFAHPFASSDVFSDARRQLTLGRGAFNGLALGADIAFSLRNDLDLTLGLDWSGSSSRSEFRDYVDNNELPIEQTTSLVRVPLTASLKWYLAPRGRSVGRYAWIPAKYAPYLGAGAGLMWYSFQQKGDFVDFKTLKVFATEFGSSQWGATAHALAGFEYSINQRMGISTEGRYVWSRAGLGSDFSGFQPIDLSGFTTSVGLLIRF